MAEYRAIIEWKRSDPDFGKGRYSRAHTWKFDGGASVPASASPHVVPAPWSDPAGVDPEEAFVAAIASCHMLTFLWLASREGFVVDDYQDTAIGIMAKNDRGMPWVSQVTLRPRVTWSGAKSPSASDLDRLHHRAHDECYIANSIKTTVSVESPE